MSNTKLGFSGFNFGDSKWQTQYTGINTDNENSNSTISESTFTQPIEVKGYTPSIGSTEEDAAALNQDKSIFLNAFPGNFNLSNPKESSILDITAGTIIRDNKNNYNIKSGTNSVQEKISKKLQAQLGLTPEQAAGILTHIDGESAFNIGAENAAEKAGKNSAVKSDEYGIGLIQWTGGRHRKFSNYIKNHGGINTVDSQVDFMVDEIKNDYKDYLAALKMARTPEEASDITYIMYVGGGKRYGVGSKYNNIDDLMSQVSRDSDALSVKYQNKHKELGYKVQDHRIKRKNNSVNFVFAKRGGFLPRIKNY